MKCPVCPDSILVMADRSGIEIDYCPTCRGVWLDRGELDKIIERAAVAMPVTMPVAAAAPTSPTSRPAAATANSKYHSKYHQPQYKKKKSSFLGDLFEF
ncbi:MAG: zf-TFIIB domain-containing protein [Actinobacteria bacterium]|nr:zf-TFIIB domain-containing protein [Actinomycetota bacterium]